MRRNSNFMVFFQENSCHTFEKFAIDLQNGVLRVHTDELHFQVWIFELVLEKLCLEIHVDQALFLLVFITID